MRGYLLDLEAYKSLFACTSSEGSDETSRLHRPVGASVALIHDKFENLVCLFNLRKFGCIAGFSLCQFKKACLKNDLIPF